MENILLRTKHTWIVIMKHIIMSLVLRDQVHK